MTKHIKIQFYSEVHRKFIHIPTTHGYGMVKTGQKNIHLFHRLPEVGHPTFIWFMISLARLSFYLGAVLPILTATIFPFVLTIPGCGMVKTGNKLAL